MPDDAARGRGGRRRRRRGGSYPPAAADHRAPLHPMCLEGKNNNNGLDSIRVLLDQTSAWCFHLFQTTGRNIDPSFPENASMLIFLADGGMRRREGRAHANGGKPRKTVENERFAFKVHSV